jgi:hypothetical protein
MARSLSISRKLRLFVALDGRRQALLIEAAFCLLLARLTLLVMPFPRLARRLGTFVAPADRRVAVVNAQAHAQHIEIAQDISWAIIRAAYHIPFRAVCLPQAMAARVMLSRRRVPSVMHFGAIKGTDKSLEAHAWLDAGSVEVVGYPVAQNTAEIACIV